MTKNLPVKEERGQGDQGDRKSDQGDRKGRPIGVKLSQGQAAPAADGRYSSASGAWEWNSLP